MNHTTTPDPLRGCSVIELRQYEMQPGRRDELITLFEREFIEAQQALGLQVLGIFRDADAPDRFIWLRGFTDMATRAAGLQAFYGGPVWHQHRAAANATMIDSDNVLLLRPLARAWPTGHASGTGTWHALICPLKAPWPTVAAPSLPTGAAWFATHGAPNDFPRLPVRDGSWLLALSPQPLEPPDTLRPRLSDPATWLRLVPTDRSPLR